MQYTLRTNPSAALTLSPALPLVMSDASARGGKKAPLSKKVSRTFTISRSRKTTAGGPSTSSSSQGNASDSDASSTKSTPSSPRDAAQQDFFRSSSPTSSVSTAETLKNGRADTRTRRDSTDSIASVYAHGYGSGQYAVNLEDLYAKESLAQQEESVFAAKGLRKFTAQEYLSIL